MAKIDKVQEVAIDTLKAYAQNAKTHSVEQVEQIKKSIKEFGFLSPCIIDKDKNIIAGHGRVKAAQELGLKSVPCVFVEGLTDTQRRAYILADNRLTELGGWDFGTVGEELQKLLNEGFDVELTGFDVPEIETGDWFERTEIDGTKRQEGNDEYNAFLEKFEEAKTTDDCYTPPNIYEAVAEWVAKEYNLDRASFIRPFYPGGDYQKEDYTGKIVVDNPPFSILADIEKWYNERGIKYFLFAPNTSILQGGRRACAVGVGVGVTYENGAEVLTSFVTTLDENQVRTAPDLYQIIAKVDRENTKGRELPKYEYPHEVLTGTKLGYLSKYGQDFRAKPEETSERISGLDSQKETGKSIFGGGFFLSEKKAAEIKAAKEAADHFKDNREKEEKAPIIWELSDREREIVKSLK